MGTKSRQRTPPLGNQSNSGSLLRPSPHLPALSLQSAHTLLPPLRSHSLKPVYTNSLSEMID